MRNVMAVGLFAWLLAGCATQPPGQALASRMNGQFTIVDASNDPSRFSQIAVDIDGSGGVARLSGSESAAQRKLYLSNCRELGSDTLDGLNWKTSFLDGQKADVVRCLASGDRTTSWFAVAISDQGLEYHPPVLARALQHGTRDIASTDGRIVFLWNGGATTAYALGR
jgi:hypothetical protein